MSELAPHERANRDFWNAEADRYQAEQGVVAAWGVWSLPEAESNVLGDVSGKNVLELGCGAAQWGIALARRGARVVGLDVSERQLAHARAALAEAGLEFPLVCAGAEAVPLPDASFDLAVSEYGASIWCDPYRWIPEAARLLRPGGELVFLVNGTLLMLCMREEEVPPGPELLRPYFGMHRFEWPDGDSVEFHLGYGDWIRLLHANGLEVEDLIEVQAPENARPHRYAALATLDWARRWPSEQIWRARKRA